MWKDSEKAVNTFVTWQQRENVPHCYGEKHIRNPYPFSGWPLVGNEGINLYIGILGMKLLSFPTKGQLVSYPFINCHLHCKPQIWLLTNMFKNHGIWYADSFETIKRRNTGPAESDSFDWGAADIEKALRSFLEAGELCWFGAGPWQVDGCLTLPPQTWHIDPVKKCRESEQLPINWCRISAINSTTSICVYWLYCMYIDCVCNMCI